MSSHPNPKPEPRLAQLDDAKKITKLINAAFRLAESFFIETDRITDAEVQELLRTGNFLLIEGGDALSGCVYVESRGERAYLGLLSVNPEQQAAGVGSLLMSAGEDHCRKWGCQFMDILIVNLREDLPGFYERRGYVKTGTAPFPPEVKTKLPVHFITMSKRLD